MGCQASDPSILVGYGLMGASAECHASLSLSILNGYVSQGGMSAMPISVLVGYRAKVGCQASHYSFLGEYSIRGSVWYQASHPSILAQYVGQVGMSGIPASIF
jgi:hypothetical protein